MAYYVDNDGSIHQYRVGPCFTIELDNGTVLADPPPGEMFATEVSAKKYSDLIHELGSARAAKEAHREWLSKNGR